MKQHKIAKAFEARIAEDLGGRRIFLSGAGSEKADVRVRKRYKQTDTGIVPTDQRSFRIEAKTTSVASYTFRVADWDDVARTASRAGEEPIFAIGFFGQSIPQEYVLIQTVFDEELGHTGHYIPLDVKNSWTLNAKKLLMGRQRTVINLPLAEDPVVLVLRPYHEFLQKLRKIQ